MYFTHREDFDQHLHQHFINKGGDVYHHSISLKTFIENNSITFGEQTLEYNYLIGADGANSVTRKLIDQNYKPDGLRMEVEIDTIFSKHAKNLPLYILVWCQMAMPDFSQAERIYGGRRLSGKFKDRHQKIFHHFMQVIGVDFGVAAVKGAFIPYGRPLRFLQPATSCLLAIRRAGGSENGEGNLFCSFVWEDGYRIYCGC
ncbi:MAG: hypothetical protein IPN13_12600 [Bacteroidetes bacterium]|nr:hypothetical protein [Bacteroidota bacterium]